jgi:hypothetical protein
MNKNAVALITMIVVTISVISHAATHKSTQTRCSLTEATAPSIRGLRLGMTADELLALFPGVAKKKELKAAIEQAKSTSAVDAAYLGFDPATDGDAQRFAGVDSVSAGVYKGRVVDFIVQYGGATWKDVDEWIVRLSETFPALSAQSWTTGANEAPSKVLSCDGIVIEAAILGGGASIRMRSNAYIQGIEERAKAAEEKKRQATKP